MDFLCFCRFTLVQKHTVEFNQVAMANSEGSEVMLNRVMTKDNIGVAVLLEVNKDMFSGGKNVSIYSVKYPVETRPCFQASQKASRVVNGNI